MLMRFMEEEDEHEDESDDDNHDEEEGKINPFILCSLLGFLYVCSITENISASLLTTECNNISHIFLRGY